MKTVHFLFSILILIATAACGSAPVEIEPNIMVRYVPADFSEDGENARVEYINPKTGDKEVLTSIRIEQLADGSFPFVVVEVTADESEEAAATLFVPTGSHIEAQPVSIQTAISAGQTFKVDMRLVDAFPASVYRNVYQRVMKAQTAVVE